MRKNGSTAVEVSEAAAPEREGEGESKHNTHKAPVSKRLLFYLSFFAFGIVERGL